MKRIVAIFTALAIFFCAGAFAFSGTDYPTWDGTSTPENSLYGSINGNKLLLDFDASSDYSNIADGFIQACFFAFDAGEQNYLEMYLMLPENARSGDVFSSASAGMTSISLYEVSMNSETLYFAGQAAGFAYPEGSSFELKINSLQKDSGSITISGSLSGALCRFDGASPTRETLSLSDVSFHFTLPTGGTAAAPQPSVQPQFTPLPEASKPPFQTRPPQDAPTAAPANPKATMDPHPAFTLPPDYAVV